MEIKKGSGIALLLAAVGMLSACGRGDDNNPPVAEAQFITIDEDVITNIKLTGLDSDADVLSYKITTVPSNGSLNGIVPNLSYSPNANFNGEDTFEFSVSDGKAESEIAIVRITINPLDDIPIAETITANTKEEEAVTIELKGSDPEGATLSYIVKANPSNGTLSGTMPNLLYTPSLDFNGIDTFSFTVNDGGLESAEGIVNITVNPVNDAPSAESQSLTMDEDVPKAFVLTGSDIDGDTSLNYLVVSGPTSGSLTGTAPNLIYTPSSNYYGTDEISFVVNDGSLDSVSGVITFEVRPVNDFVDNHAASVVIGQVDFDSTDKNQTNTDTPKENTLKSPYGNSSVANGVLYLPDAGNRRILGFNAIPNESNASANFVIGQPDFSTTNTTLSDVGTDSPQSVSFDENRMFVVEEAVNRVLIWNSIPTSGGVPAEIVLGQDNFGSSTAGCTSVNFSSPESLWAANGKLVVADRSNNRVLIWNNIPSDNNVQADLVLGQQDFNHCGANDLDNDGNSDSPSASTLNEPAGVWTDGTKLVVLDYSNHRALIWNTFPSSSFAPADIVLGQNGFDVGTVNNGVSNPTASTLNSPYNGVYSNGRQLYITDSENNRVLIWNEFPSINFAPADVVLGQVDMFSNTPNASAASLNFPAGIYLHGSQLIVADGGNNRYLIYNE